MCVRSAELKLLGALVLASVLACSSAPAPSARDVADANDSGRTLVAQTASERELLKRVARLPNNGSQRVGTLAVVAEPTYQAASGRQCRALHITAAAGQAMTHRLACTGGGSWVFVPDVFGSQTSPDPE